MSAGWSGSADVDPERPTGHAASVIALVRQVGTRRTWVQVDNVRQHDSGPTAAASGLISGRLHPQAG